MNVQSQRGGRKSKRAPRRKKAKTAAGKSLALAKKNASQIRALNKNWERKYHDTATTVSTSDSWSTAQPLVDPAQGDTALLRDGNRMVLKRLKFRAAIPHTDNTNTGRVIIAMFNSDVGATPTIDHVLETSSTYPDAQVTPYQKNPKVKYKVLYDSFYQCGQALANATAFIKFDWKPKGGHLMKWDPDVSSTIPVLGGIYMWHIGDSAVISHPQFTYYSRAILADS